MRKSAAWILALAVGGIAAAQEPSGPLLAGHSMHGEAFNEGPRQKAYLMDGMPPVEFPVSTQNPLAQRFFNQGVGQLHGFWYFEAERSFRHAAAIDPACAMAYWGMAMANINNDRRARGFLAEAQRRKAGAAPKEAAWIEALSQLHKEGGQKTEREKAWADALEQMAAQYPEDIEVKAFYVCARWQAGNVSKEQRDKCDALLNDIFKANPLHPAHHYRIHLWNYQDDSRALGSAALGGPSGPGIAHLWHMPGHTYWQLKRYEEAAWQQEASARVDHAHLMRDRVLPDQIHNYAHNNEWLVRTLNHLGRARDAIRLAMNMIELPRHPVYNSFGNSGSAALGRQRLLDTLIRYELWDEILRLSRTSYLEPTDRPQHRAQRLHAVGLAAYHLRNLKTGDAALADLEGLLQELTKADQAAEKKENGESRPGPNAAERESADKRILELKIYRALAHKDPAEARKLLAKEVGIPKERLARVWLELGDADQALKLAKEAAESAPGEVQPLANYAAILHKCGKDSEAAAKLTELRSVASHADLDVPVIQRLAPLARACRFPADWRTASPRRADQADRPSLESLGPFRWQPVAAPDWSLPDPDGRRISLRDYRGKPLLVIFYLGAGCAHCMRQLNLFAPAFDRFRQAGIRMVAISTETVEGLHKTFEASGRSAFPFPLVSDSELRVFKQYRAFDDFEQTPLHGTFLIDGRGLLRWQDISYEPFTEIEFLVAESRRLLAQDRTALPAQRASRSTRQARSEPFAPPPWYGMETSQWRRMRRREENR